MRAILEALVAVAVVPSGTRSVTLVTNKFFSELASSDLFAHSTHVGLHPASLGSSLTERRWLDLSLRFLLNQRHRWSLFLLISQPISIKVEIIVREVTERVQVVPEAVRLEVAQVVASHTNMIVVNNLAIERLWQVVVSLWVELGEAVFDLLFAVALIVAGPVVIVTVMMMMVRVYLLVTVIVVVVSWCDDLCVMMIDNYLRVMLDNHIMMSYDLWMTFNFDNNLRVLFNHNIVVNDRLWMSPVALFDDVVATTVVILVPVMFSHRRRRRHNLRVVMHMRCCMVHRRLRAHVRVLMIDDRSVVQALMMMLAVLVPRVFLWCMLVNVFD